MLLLLRVTSSIIDIIYNLVLIVAVKLSKGRTMSFRRNIGYAVVSFYNVSTYKIVNQWCSLGFNGASHGKVVYLLCVDIM